MPTRRRNSGATLRWRIGAALMMLAGVASAGAPVAAQTLGDPAAAAPIQTGPIGLAPRLAIRNLGIDRNVFNAAGEPVSDLTASITPSLDVYLRARRLRLASRTQLHFGYFQKSASQRSVDVSQEARVDVDLLRVIPFAAVNYVRTRQRQNFDLDERIAQHRRGWAVGAQIPMFAKLRIEGVVRRDETDLGATEFGNPVVADALNRSSTETSLGARLELTSLTTFVLRSGIRRDRFEFSPLRNSDTWFLLPGLEFEPLALVSGQAHVGIQRFTTVRPDLPDLFGLVASVDLRYAIRDTTRIGGRVNRDVGYSFNPVQPYFQTTSMLADITQAVSQRWRLAGRAGRTMLAYQSVGGDASVPARRETVVQYGFSLSRLLSRRLTVGVDADWNLRRSPQATREFNGFRMGGFIVYGS